MHQNRCVLGLMVHQDKVSWGGWTTCLLSEWHILKNSRLSWLVPCPMTLTGYVSKIHLNKVARDCSLRCTSPTAWKTCPEKHNAKWEAGNFTRSLTNSSISRTTSSNPLEHRKCSWQFVWGLEMPASVSSRCDICRCDAEPHLGAAGCRTSVITKTVRKKAAAAAKMKLTFWHSYLEFLLELFKILHKRWLCF